MKSCLLLFSTLYFLWISPIDASNRFNVEADSSNLATGDTLFFEDWESGQLGSMWSATSSLEVGRVEVASGTVARNGNNGLRMGSTVNNRYNVNTLDLQLQLAAHAGKDLVLEYWIYDNRDDFDQDDLIAFSDDGGATFVTILDWKPAGEWTNYVYGKLLPLDLDAAIRAAGLEFTDDFVIRFQQGGDDNFDFDGLFLDDILVREETVTYAELPFTEGFEAAALTGVWRRASPTGVTSATRSTPGNVAEVFRGEDFARTGTGGLALGRRADDNYSVSAADLRLNLAGYTEVELRFWRKRFYDEDNDDDGLWISGDGGGSFEKMFTFRSADFPNLIYQEVVIDLDSTLLALGMALTEEVVVRFQQGGHDDFSGQFNSNADGMTIDDVSVTGSVDETATMITSFAPTEGAPGTVVTITGVNFTAQTAVSFGGAASEQVNFVNGTTLRATIPRLGQSGKIAAVTGTQRTASQEDFTVLGREVIFFEDWESGQLRSMWTVGSTSEFGLVDVATGVVAKNGANGLRMSSTVSNRYNVNTLDLRLPLAEHAGKDLVLEYWIYDNRDDFDQDDLIALSDDGGATFTTIVNWRPSAEWTDYVYGKLPPLDLDAAARAAGLEFTDDFIIRFQQGADDNTVNDGLYLDDILIREETVVYAQLPFEDAFSVGTLSPAWRWVDARETGSGRVAPGGLVEVLQAPAYALSEPGGLVLGRRADDNFTLSAVDLHLDLAAYTEAELRFWRKRFYDEEEAPDGLWISDDGGATFEKIYAFRTDSFPNLTFREVVIDLDEALLSRGRALTDRVVVRFQQWGPDDFFGGFNSNTDGMAIDDVKVTGSTDGNAPRITSFSPTEGEAGTEVTIEGINFSAETVISFAGVASTEVTFVSSSRMRALVPALAQSGKIGATNERQRTASQEDFIVNGREVIFFEDWESGRLRSMWTAGSTTDFGLVDVVRGTPALNGANGLRMGSSQNNTYNVNTLDLRIPLAAHADKELLLEYWIYDNNDDFDQDDLIAISDDGGVTFTSIVNWQPTRWTNGIYGKLPPLDLDAAVRAAGLSFTDDFVIRFQHGADDNTFNDGLYLDDILIREETVVYAPLPFRDQYDAAELSPAWRWVNPEGASSTGQTTPGGFVAITRGSQFVRTETGALAFGRRSDNNVSINAADLHLNLAGLTDVELRFWRKRYYDEENSFDGVWVSDDGGASFEKMYTFRTDDFPNLSYQEVVIDLDSTLMALGMALTERVIVRFQQEGVDDFSGGFNSAEDGMTIDDVTVTGSTDAAAPVITAFSPLQGVAGTEVTISGRNFTAETAVTFAGVSSETVLFVNSTTLRAIVPPLAQTGKIGAAAGVQRTASQEDFTVLGREVIFYEDWESGRFRSMWSTNSSTDFGRIEVVGGVVARSGANGVRMGSSVNRQYNVNTLDLRIPLAAHADKELVLEYAIYDNADDFDEDDFIAISDDGGTTFTPIVDWQPTNWIDNRYGQLPPLDLDAAVRAAGREFTDDFVIRFQQGADDNLDFDGLFLDDIRIREESVIHAPLPFTEHFDASTLSPAWQWVNPAGTTTEARVTPGGLLVVFPGSRYVRSEPAALVFGRQTDNNYSANAADLHLDLAGYTEAELRFWRKRFYDESEVDDGLWVSDDGGASFVPLYVFTEVDFPNLTYQEVVIDLDSALLALDKTLSSEIVIRFQQGGSDDFSGAFSRSEDGMAIDDITVSGTLNPNYPSISFLEPSSGPVGTQVIIRGQNLANTDGVSFNGTPAVVEARNATSVRTTVPASATSGVVTVTAPIGPANSPGIFRVTEGNDLALVEIETPTTGCELSSTEVVTVRIRNAGAFASTGTVRLALLLDGSPVVTDEVELALGSLEETRHVFTRTVDLSTTGSYEVEVRLTADGDEVADNNLLVKTVRSNAAPTAEITGPGRICNGNQAELVAAGGSSYRWNTGSSAANIFVRPVVDTDYSVSVTSSEGCTAVVTYQLGVKTPEQPIITATNDGILCPGGTVTLTSSVTEDIRWNTDEFMPSIEVVVGGFYTVTHTEEGCETVSEFFRVQSTPFRGIQILGSSQLCDGDSTVLRASGGESFVWSTGETTQEIRVRPRTTTTYGVTITENNCALTDERTIEVFPNVMPGEASALLPEDGSGSISTVPVLSWAPAADADRYDVYLWQEGTPEPTVPIRRNVFAISTQVGPLQIDATYNWYVVAQNSCQTGAPSVTQQFTTASLPDLTVVEVEGPATALSGAEIGVRWTVRNAGIQSTPAARSWRDGVYLSNDRSLSQDDLFLGASNNGSILGPGIAYPGEASVRLPICAEGDFFVIVVADYLRWIAETDESNNAATSLRAIPITLSPKPDLVVDTIRQIGVNGQIGEGEPATITYAVANLGTGAVGRSFNERIFLNREDFDNPQTRIPLSSETRSSPMEPGGRAERTVVVNLPPGLNGEFYFYVLTDFFDAVEECLFEDNNRKRFGPVRIIADPRPDFVVNTVTAVDTASTGERIDLSYTITNEGIDHRGGVNAEVYLSSTPDFNRLSRLQRFTIGEELLTNVATTGTVAVQLPNNLSGEWYLSLLINPDNRIDEGSNFDAGNQATTRVTILAPDLSAGVPRPAADTVVAGSSVIVDWTIRNEGPGRIINQLVRDDIRLGNTFVGAVLDQAVSLAADDMAQRQLTLNVPENLPPGDYAINLRTNASFSVFEAGNFQNNTATSDGLLTVVAPEKPDLVAQAFSIDGEQFLRGAQVPVTYTVSNEGVAAISGSWQDGIYLSGSPIWSPFNAQLLTLRNQARELGVDVAYEDSFEVTLPNFLAAGTYYLHLRLNATGTLFEETESNNGAVVGPIQVSVLPPDTRVDLVLFDVVSDTIRAGRTVNLSWKVRNAGNGTTVAGSWQDVLLLSADNTPDAGDRVIARWPREGDLRPGQQYARLETFRLPDTLPAGAPRLILVADGERVTQDDRRSNNQRILSVNREGGGVVISQPPRPDLVIAVEEVLAPGVAGQPLRVAYTVTNQGSDTSATGQWYDGARLSNSTAYNGPEVGRSQQTRDLAPGMSYRDTIMGQLPIEAEGNFFLTLRANAGNNLAETQRNNNDGSIFLPVVRPLPGDLVLERPIAPASAQTNDTITVSWTLRNTGDNPVEGFLEHSIYFSTDTEWDITDVSLGRWRGTIALGVNGSVTQEQEVCLTDLGDGDYYVIVRADVLDNIVESDNENNTGVSEATVEVGVPQLFVGQEEITRLGQRKPLYYRLEVDEALEGQTLRLSLNSETASASNELYTRYGAVPNRTTFDERYGELMAADQEIIVSDLRRGTHYLMAFGAVGPAEQDICLLAELVPFAITAINTNTGGNTGPVTTLLTGTRFSSGMEVELRDGAGMRIPAEQVRMQTPERAFVTFDLGGAALGTYDVIATSSQTADTDTLPDGFRVVTGTSPSVLPTLSCGTGPGSPPLFFEGLDPGEGADSPLRLEKVHPATARRNQLIPMTFRYVNEGNIDVAVPRLLITSLGGAPLSLDPSIFNPETLELGMEFQEADGPPDVLRPGGVATYSIYTRATSELLFRLQ